MMIWIYRLQQRIALTRDECVAIATLALLLLGGMAARHLQGGLAPASEAAYAEGDRLFLEGARAGFADTVAAAHALAPDDPPEAAAASERAGSPLRLNLNTASAAELEGLPRIGPKLAARIVAYREAHGPFRQVDALVEVRGVGEKTLIRLRPYLYVEPEARGE